MIQKPDTHPPTADGTSVEPGASLRASGEPGCFRLLAFVGGIGLILIGVPMLVCPGPGMLAIGAGAAMALGALGITRRTPPSE